MSYYDVNFTGNLDNRSIDSHFDAFLDISVIFGYTGNRENGLGWEL